MIKLGEFSLENYLQSSNSIAGNDENLQAMRDIMQKLKSPETLNVEILPLNEELDKRIQAQYGAIDLSFLGIKNEIMYKGVNFSLPKFSIYSTEKDGFSKFNLEFKIERIAFHHGLFNMKQSISYRGGAFIGNSYRMPGIIRKPIEECIKYWDELKGDDLENYAKKLGMFVHPNREDAVSFASEFHGLIPNKTKAKIKDGKMFFDDRLFLISETRPEEWNTTVIKSDPLIIGVTNKRKAFLLDSFSTTSYEDYVKNEFSAG